jgi:hypothetical protein
MVGRDTVRRTNKAKQDRRRDSLAVSASAQNGIVNSLTDAYNNFWLYWRKTSSTMMTRRAGGRIGADVAGGRK